MSDLVEKVVNEIAICRKSGGINCEQDCDYCKDDATRAIKAVAQHLAGIGYPFGAGRVAQTTGGQRMSDARTVIAKTTHSWRVLNFSAAEREADAILAALAEAGLVIVPRVPTEKMTQHVLTALDSCALEDVERIYRLFVEAANDNGHQGTGD